MRFKNITIFVLTIIFVAHNFIFSYSSDKNYVEIQSDIDEQIINLDDNFFNSENLGIGVFFSNSIGVKKVDENGNYITDDRGNYIYETDENGNYITKPDDTINKDLGLYVTNNGKDFTYIGETGISGRDPNIFYRNGVFYMATTKGASNSGKIIFNLFKSTDLVNWTNDTDAPYAYRYEPADIPNNIYSLPATTWSPKFMVDGDEIYLLISIQKFTQNYGSLYYVKGNDQSLINAGLVNKSEDGTLSLNYDSADNNTLNNIVSLYNSNPNKDLQKINPDIGILVEETPVLDENGNTILDKEGKITTKRKIVIDPKGKIIQEKCPWYNYPIFDSYIAKVESLGSDLEQTDLNMQNLTFGDFKKVNFKGFTYNSEANNTYLDKKYSMLGGYLLKNNNNDEYKYTMYTKTDPYGTVQRWIAKTIDGEWIQVDDRYYVSSNSSESIESISGHTVCSQKEALSKHIWRLGNDLTFNGIDDSTVFKNHYEGSCLSTFGNDTFIYTDHYIINDKSEVTASTDSEEYIPQVSKVAGIYYSQLDTNIEGKAITDLGVSTDHARYKNFVKITTLNTKMRPTVAKDNQLRNGCVFTNDQKEDKDNFKKVLKNASKFNTSYIKEYADIDKGKITVVLKSNRALQEMDSDSGWKYASQMQDDTNLNKAIKDKYGKFNKSIPYSITELYIYKTFDLNETENEKVTVCDMLGNKAEENINLRTNDATPPTITNVSLSNSESTNQNVSINFNLSDSCGVLLGAIFKELDKIVEFTAFEDFVSFERKGKNKTKRVENHKIKVTIEVDMVCGAV